ncbi:sigma-70 family RNA polymerase sigma factor [Propionicicella superfundia]|uniref:sigma-70 family RNA polymerase sigma factor n=1 Tax=Propionicicella superfundia TaxID=348582 RepID=UPI00048FD2B2|nr:sigma factor [Propionicicella superfundia]
MTTNNSEPEDRRDDGTDVALAIAVEAGVYAEQVLSGRVTTGVGATPAELARVAAAGRRAWRELIEAHLRLVGFLARQEARRTGRSQDELFQEGCVGLIEALERFDHRRGVRPATAAGPWIRAAMGRVDAHATLTSAAAKRRGRRSRTRRMAGELFQVYQRPPSTAEVAARTGEDVHRVAGWLATEPATVPLHTADGGVEVPDRRWDPGAACPGLVPADLPRLVAGLPPAERRVIEVRYRLGVGGPRASWPQVAASLGIGVTTARRLEATALERLRSQGACEVA